MAPNFSQSSSQFLASIDAEIQRLQDLRQQVAAAVDADHAVTQTAKVVRRGMSEEGRRKIAAAQKARWAKQKKANKSAAKAPAQKTAVKQIAKKATAKKSTVKKSVSKKAAAVKTTEQP